MGTDKFQVEEKQYKGMTEKKRGEIKLGQRNSQFEGRHKERMKENRERKGWRDGRGVPTCQELCY